MSQLTDVNSASAVGMFVVVLDFLFIPSSSIMLFLLF